MKERENEAGWVRARGSVFSTGWYPWYPRLVLDSLTKANMLFALESTSAVPPQWIDLAEEKMKKLYRAAIIALLLGCCGVYASSQTPPDGNVGIKNGGHSESITTLATPLTFSSCAGAAAGSDTALDCALFGGAQEIFAGIDDTGYAWNTLTIDLTGYNPTTDPVVTCDGGSDFQNCSIAVIGTTLAITFTQGDGTGVSCDIYTNNCVTNSVNAALNDLNGNPLLPYDSFPPFCNLPGAVCGSDEFVIGIGYGSTNGVSNAFNTPLSANGSLGADGVPAPPITPEPQTLVLVGGAMIGMLVLAIKKGLLA